MEVDHFQLRRTYDDLCSMDRRNVLSLPFEILSLSRDLILDWSHFWIRDRVKHRQRAFFHYWIRLTFWSWGICLELFLVSNSLWVSQLGLCHFRTLSWKLGQETDHFQSLELWCYVRLCICLVVREYSYQHLAVLFKVFVSLLPTFCPLKEFY